MAEECVLFVADAEGLCLLAVRCRHCSYVDFPRQSYGCRRCGAYGEDLVPAHISAVGTIRAGVVVHDHADKTEPVPFAVATVQLESGPVTRVVLRAVEHVSIGDRVFGEIVHVGDGGSELRFAKEVS